MKKGVLVAEAFFPGAQGAKVLGRFGHHIVVELENDSTPVRSSKQQCFLDTNIKKNERIASNAHFNCK